MASSSSSSRVMADVETHQERVFINFRGVELRYNFVSHLNDDLKRNGINAFIDTDEDMGKELNVLLKRIEESRIALAIFSPRYTESNWCLKELEKMKERMEQSKLVVIPIFYKVQPVTVKELQGEFGDRFRKLVKSIDKNTKNKWKEALRYVPILTGLVLHETSDESELIKRVIKEVKKVLNNIPHVSPNPQECIVSSPPSRQQKKHESTCGIEQRLEQLEKKLSSRFEGTTCTIGVVGMPGIGKSTLARKLYEKLKDEFLSYTLIPDVHEISKKDGLSYLLTILLEDLLNIKDPNIETVQDAHQIYKDQLLRTKVFVVLDNVTSKDQIDALLGKRDWIKQGSKIVIATRDKSLIQNFVDDIYEIPGLSARDALQHFVHYAFHDQEGSALRLGNFSKLSNDFVHYTKGNPLALKILGTELFGKDETHWDLKLKALDYHHKSPLGHSWLQKVWEGSYDGLNQQEKDMLLDIACFRSLDENYLVSLLESDDTRNVMEDLVNMFMININAGKVQMHDTLYMLSKVLGQEATATDGKGRHRLWHHHTITDMLKNNKGASNVRSIFLDLSDITRKMSFHSSAFAKMRDLRYLKIYSTNCSRDCDHDIKDDTKLNFPEGIQLPLNEVRCLHWLKFPWKELPQDFNPFNLVDLKLPYSKIERVWEDNKDAPKLKWVNLNHSKKLNTLAGLGKAQNLQELNLEGCTALKQLHVNMQNMKCLVFLNLRGCTSLKSLPDIQLISLKTLILSDCTKFKEFHVISSKLEVIYLDGTAIKELKFDIEFFQSLVFLNMKGCKKLKRLPDNLGELKAFEELILSGCSKLKTFPEIGGNRSRLGILLLDETAIEETPKIVSVRRLCLSKNEKISRLPNLINQFPQLQWLDLKYCKNLTQVPQLPPNLQCLDVRGCNSLKTIVKPLVCSIPMKHINSTFIFTKCNELEQAAKEEISSYAERKCQLLSSALKHCDESCVPEILSCTSFPGCEMPSWFSHGAIGSIVEFKLPPHWNHNRLSGIALCVVVSFQNCQNHANLTVRFSCEQNNGEGSCTNITWKVGSLIEQDSKVNTVELDHVLIGYTNCSSFIKLVEGQSPRKCAPTKALLEFKVTAGTGGGGEARFQVLKSGFSFVFKPEEIRVPFARNGDVKGKTKINGTRSANGCFTDQAYGDESPKGQWQTNTYIESSTYIPDEASSSQTSGIDSTRLC